MTTKRLLNILCMMLTLVANTTIVRGMDLEEVAKVRENAKKAYYDKDLGQAIANYRKAIALGDSSYLPAFNLACCYSIAGKLDSAEHYMEMALDHEYMDYVGMTMDKDLWQLQQRPSWQGYCTKAFNNSAGKMPAMKFRQNIGAMMLNGRMNTIGQLMEKRSPELMIKTQNSLMKMKELAQFSEASANNIIGFSNLRSRTLKYEPHRFVKYETHEFSFPITVINKEVANLLSKENILLHTRTINEDYTLIDSITTEEKMADLDIKRLHTQLSDSVKLLALRIGAEKAQHYEFVVKKNIFKSLPEILNNVQKMSKAEFDSVMAKQTNFYYIRMVDLPFDKKKFKGLKVAFSKESDAMIIVGDNEKYTFARHEKLAKLAKEIDKIVGK